MKYYDVYTDNGKMAVKAACEQDAIRRYCTFSGIIGEPPKQYKAVEITAADYNARYYKIA